MAPNLAGTNCLTKSEDGIVELLANLPAFQIFAGVPGDVAAARAAIYVHEMPQTLEPDADAWTEAEWMATFPRALVLHPTDGEAFSFNQHARDTIEQFVLTQRYSLIFEAYANSNFNAQDQARWFMNLVGDVLEAVTTVSGLYDGQFAPMVISVEVPFHRREYARMQHLGDTMAIGIRLERFVE